jgi:hypothetical protein
MTTDARGQALSVGAERQADRAQGKTTESEFLLTGLRIPNPDLAVAAARDKTPCENLSVRRKGQATDMLTLSLLREQ